MMLFYNLIVVYGVNLLASVSLHLTYGLRLHVQDLGCLEDTCFTLYRTKVNATEARDTCISAGSHLLTLSDKRVREETEKWLNMHNMKRAWVGAALASTEGMPELDCPSVRTNVARKTERCGMFNGRSSPCSSLHATVCYKESDGGVCPGPFTQVFGYCLYLDERKVTWYSAWGKCLALGADLIPTGHFLYEKLRENRRYREIRNMLATSRIPRPIRRLLQTDGRNTKADVTSVDGSLQDSLPADETLADETDLMDMDGSGDVYPELIKPADNAHRLPAEDEDDNRAANPDGERFLLPWVKCISSAWIWNTGEVMTDFEGWASESPRVPPQPCLTINKTQDGRWFLEDTNCKFLSGFICQQDKVTTALVSTTVSGPPVTDKDGSGEEGKLSATTMLPRSTAVPPEDHSTADLQNNVTTFSSTKTTQAVTRPSRRTPNKPFVTTDQTLNVIDLGSTESTKGLSSTYRSKLTSQKPVDKEPSSSTPTVDVSTTTVVYRTIPCKDHTGGNSCKELLGTTGIPEGQSEVPPTTAAPITSQKSPGEMSTPATVLQTTGAYQHQVSSEQPTETTKDHIRVVPHQTVKVPKKTFPPVYATTLASTINTEYARNFSIYRGYTWISATKLAFPKSTPLAETVPSHSAHSSSPDISVRPPSSTITPARATGFSMQNIGIYIAIAGSVALSMFTLALVAIVLTRNRAMREKKRRPPVPSAEELDGSPGYQNLQPVSPKEELESPIYSGIPDQEEGVYATIDQVDQEMTTRHVGHHNVAYHAPDIVNSCSSANTSFTTLPHDRSSSRLNSWSNGSAQTATLPPNYSQRQHNGFNDNISHQISAEYPSGHHKYSHRGYQQLGYQHPSVHHQLSIQSSSDSGFGGSSRSGSSRSDTTFVDVSEFSRRGQSSSSAKRPEYLSIVPDPIVHKYAHYGPNAQSHMNNSFHGRTSTDDYMVPNDTRAQSWHWDDPGASSPPGPTFLGY